MKKELYIGDVKIEINDDGFYKLSDLHKASGGQPKHKPALYTSNDKFNDLVNSLEKAGKPTFYKSVGRNGGTWVCKEIVYDYAMWISSDFKLKVIKAYDDQMTLEGSINSNLKRFKSKVDSIMDESNRITAELEHLKEHGTNWSAYGRAIKQAKKMQIEALKEVENKIQLQLDFLG